MNLKLKILVIVYGGIMMCLSAANAVAQETGKHNNRSKVIYKQMHGFAADKAEGLFADGVKLKLDLSVIEKSRAEAEWDYEAIPCEDLYGGIWSDKGVQIYGRVDNIPDSFWVDISQYTMPCNGRMTSNFGTRGRSRYHYGVDLKAQKGDTIVAAFDGMVRISKYYGGYGYCVVIRHPNGLETVYGHLSRFLVHENEIVRAGQPIALAGSTGRSTGSHLHFETRFLGNAIDPNFIIDFENHVTHRDKYLVTKESFNKTRKNSRNVIYCPTADYQLGTSGGGYKIPQSKADASTPMQEPKYYTIKKGDTLGAIAKRYGVSITSLCSWNNITPRTTLHIGKSLRIS